MIWDGGVGISPLAMESSVRDKKGSNTADALCIMFSKCQINILLEP